MKKKVKKLKKSRAKKQKISQTEWVQWAGTTVLMIILAACSGNKGSNLQGLGGGGGRYSTAPHISSISPTSGPIAGGTSLYIYGNDFDIVGSSVDVGGVDCPVTSRASSFIQCTTGRTTSWGNVSVTVRNSDGQASSFSSFEYQRASAPTVNSIYPTSGPVTGGTSVNIYGSGFDSSASTVAIEGMSCAVTYRSSSMITCTTGAFSGGYTISARVEVTNPDGQTGSRYGIYRYERVPAPVLNSVYPATGPLAGGNRITIYGSNFSPRVATVTIGGLTCVANSWEVQSTVISCTVPRGSYSGNAVVVVRNGDGQVSNNYNYIYQPAPFAPVSLPPGSVPPVSVPPFGGLGFGGISSSPVSSAPSSSSSVYGSYSGSEAEVLYNNFRNRRGSGAGTGMEGINETGWIASVMIRGMSIPITSDGVPQQTVRGYTIRNRDDGVDLILRVTAEASTRGVVFNRVGQDIVLNEPNVRRLSSDLQDDILGVFDGSVEIAASGEIHPDYIERVRTQPVQSEINRIRELIDNRITTLNSSAIGGYYLNPEHISNQVQGTNRDIYLFDNPYDGRIMASLLHAISTNNEREFVQFAVDFATSYPIENAIAKRGFIDAFATLYVTKEFPSVGIRQNFFHFILRCGHLS